MAAISIARLRSLYLDLCFRLHDFQHQLIQHFSSTMASPVDSFLDTVASTNGRRMQHIKTKEECRLGNETIDVWCLELPSKHAEGILR